MAKRNIPMDEEYDIDMSSTEAVLAKLPGNIAGNLKPISSSMEIPCDRIIEYQDKRDSDFQPWPEGKFELLVESVRNVGVLEAITVRPAKDKEGFYETLAGEHRWRASIAAGKATVPAKVIMHCDDTMAALIFSITNSLRRDDCLRDRINGWWRYVEMTKYKREDEINQLISEGILPAELDKKNLQMRQIYRYAKLHDLMEDYIALIEGKKLTISGAVELAYLSPAQQEELLPYKLNIKNDKVSIPLHKLADGALKETDENGKETTLEWNKDNIEAIIFPVKSAGHYSIADATKQAKAVLKSRLNKAYYGQTKEILDEALTLYFDTHPEYKKPEKKK